MLLSDAEVMSAAEAVVCVYIQHRLIRGLRNVSSDGTLKLLGKVTAASSPSSSAAKACSGETLRRDAQSLYILSCVVEMVRSRLTCTERDVYYRNAPLFSSQCSVHSGIARLCRWMAAAAPLPAGDEPRAYTREGLRIGASGRSLLAGRLVLDVSSATVDARAHAGGVLVSTALALHGRRPRGGPAALVLVEKESTLRALLGAGAGDRVALLCTKGYPCAASRLLLRAIHRALPRLPLVALVDGDPHGLRIALTVALTAGYAPLPLQWIGVRPSRLPPGAHGRARMTERDRRVLAQVQRRAADTAAQLANTETVLRDALKEMIQEAQWMERTDIKCALQAWPEGPMHILSQVL